MEEMMGKNLFPIYMYTKNWDPKEMEGRNFIAEQQCCAEERALMFWAFYITTSNSPTPVVL